MTSITPGQARGAASAPETATDNRPLAAAGWMFLALLCFSTMAIAGREAGREIDTFELMTYRSFIGVAIVLAVLTAARRLSEIRARRMDLHLVRNVAHFSGQNLWFHAVTVIPLAQLFAYEFTSPLWVALLAPLVLGEKFTKVRALSAVLGFVGILIVARPWTAEGTADFGVGQMAALGAAICFAWNILFTKMLSRTESTASILFFMTTLQAGFGLAIAGWDLEMTWPAETWPWVVLVAVCGLAAHACVTTALSLAPASVVSPMEFLRLPMIAVAGMLLYGEPLEIAVLAGAAVVFAGNLLNVRAERRRRA